MGVTMGPSSRREALKFSIGNFGELTAVKRVDTRFELLAQRFKLERVLTPRARNASRTASLAFWYSPDFTARSMKASCSRVRLTLRVGM
jgi:hypothetical protein